MTNGLRKLGLAVALAGSALTLMPSLAQGQADLDDMDEETLELLLTDELDDILDEFDPDAEYAITDLLPAMMDALGDAGDAGDPEEAVISLGQLNAEMAEQSVTLQDVVWAALQQADELSLRERSPATDSRSLRFSNVGFGADLTGAGHDGRAKPSTAVVQGARYVKGYVKRGR